MRPRTYRFGIYPGKLIVYPTLAAWNKATGNDVAAGCVDGIYILEGSCTHHIWTSGQPGPAAHEALHLTAKQMEFIGHPITPDGDEPAAYLLQWAVERILEAAGVFQKGSEES